MEEVFQIPEIPGETFPVFVQGVLSFQAFFMFLQCLMTRRREYVFYGLYLVCFLFLTCFAQTDLEIKRSIDGSGLFAFLGLVSIMLYWLFWKSVFEVVKTDRWLYRVVKMAVWLTTISLTIFLLSIPLPMLDSWVATLIEINFWALFIIAFWLFYLTLKQKDKTLAGLLVLGALPANFITIIALGGEQKSLPYLYMASYLYETVFYTIALSYKTQLVFRRKKQLELRVTDLRISALQAQMNPHFLHNCLSALNRLILNHENDAAEHYLTKFARLIRSVLNVSQKSSVPLAEELAIVEYYLEMESLRFDGKFNYKIHSPEDGLSNPVLVPPLLVQPLVENAIHHGLLPKKGDKKLDIAVWKELNVLKIAITDNGIGRTKANERRQADTFRQPSLGLSNIRERLELLQKSSGRLASLEIEDLVDAGGLAAGTRALLTLPA